MDDSTIFITGSNGQLGTALRQKYPGARSADIDELDITNQKSIDSFDWQGTKIIINTAAYTNVDGAEFGEGRIAADKVNAQAVEILASLASAKGITLVHISTDYVFDGQHAPHTEDESFAPLNYYGQTKAAGDNAAAKTPKHFIIRTSWVIGEGKNFVRTMLELGKRGINPSVVHDQTGRLTFTSELVRAIDHLLSTRAEYGTYNVSNDGPVSSWADITRQIYKDAHLSNTVTNVTTEEYYKDKPGVAIRPLNSELDLSKIHSTGFKSHNWQDDLKAYIEQELKK